MPGSRSFLAKVWGLARPYWSSEERWLARGLLAITVALSLASIYIVVLVNRWNAAFYNAVQQLDVATFIRQLGVFAALTVANVLVASNQVYFNQMLQIRWRRWLTGRFIDAWLHDRTYCRLGAPGGPPTDNPDQRISEDLGLFIVYTLTLFLGGLSALVTLISFVAILWSLSGTLALSLGALGVIAIPGYMVWAALGYASAGTLLTHRIGRRLVPLSFDQQRFEADFRFGLGRFRDNAENIALARGEALERAQFRQRFAAIWRNYWSIMRCQRQLTCFTWGYGQMAQVVPFLIAAPRYFARQIQLGGLMQTVQAFTQVQGALSFMIDSYLDIARWQAVVDRLAEFQRRMLEFEAVRSQTTRIEVVRNGHRDIQIDGLCVQLPSGERLVNALSMTVAPGSSVWIDGGPGSGKTTLLRAISGLWPYGCGRIELPAAAREIMVSQRPYLPPGTLRQALLGGAATPEGPADRIDAELRRILNACGLPQLAAQLDASQDWTRSLSATEQACLGFACVMVQRPDVVFLDEATSMLDAGREAALYRQLRAELPDATIITVGHRPTLRAFHERYIALDAAGASTNGAPQPIEPAG